MSTQYKIEHNYSNQRKTDRHTNITNSEGKKMKSMEDVRLISDVERITDCIVFDLMEVV